VTWIAQRDDFKRILGIAIALVPIKYFIILLLHSVTSEAFNFVVLFIYLFSLPEVMVGSELGPKTIRDWIVVLCLSVVWNLIPAYFISLFLSERVPAESIKTMEH
jgi:hypothetical protein